MAVLEEEYSWGEGRFLERRVRENACGIRGFALGGGKGVGCTCETVTTSCDKRSGPGGGGVSAGRIQIEWVF
jgi:hypothetical protein